MPRVLLTSFEPFAGHALNSSLEVGRALAKDPPAGLDLDWLVLPVVARACVERVWERVEQAAPTLVLGLGEAAGAPVLRLEDRAVNVDDFPIPDNAGNHPRMEWIVPGAPGSYRTTTRIHRVADALWAARIPVERSYSAGRYVCNHLFYGLLHRAEQDGHAHQTGFIHLPLLPQQLRPGERTPTRDLGHLATGVARAVFACLEAGLHSQGI
jgi:pyroglutamyl-peptidase